MTTMMNVVNLHKGSKVAGHPVLTVRSVAIRSNSNTVTVLYEIPETSWNGRFPRMTYPLDAVVEVVRG